MKKYKNYFLNTFTYVLSSFGILILGLLIYFIFSNGISSLSISLLKNDYQAVNYNAKLVEDINFHYYTDPNYEKGHFSSKWGVVLEDKIDNQKKPIVVVSYLDNSSPLRNMQDISSRQIVRIKEEMIIEKIIMENDEGNLIISLSKEGASSIVNKMDEGIVITDMLTRTEGGGIRSSLITTLYLIFLTLIISLPLGIASAIYLSEFAPNNRFTRFLRSLIDMISGIPSIIFGLVGAVVFIPFMNVLINSDGGSIASGALTLSIMLLPIIIRTTEEGIKIVPNNLRHASLALGANLTQTTFKVVLPNALSSILTAVLLSIGRIIGESAALIYAIGTVISDEVSINMRSTSLSVHIWSLMSGENPNFEVSSAIAIIILIIVFILSALIKILSINLNKRLT
ncbi:MAG: phosphate ABC transporter permease PstA [Bacilli bacterium]